MTDNQIRAIDRLKEYKKLKAFMRILELKYDSVIEDAGPPSTWPQVGIAPGKKKKARRKRPVLER